MIEKDYINNRIVKKFIEWIGLRITGNFCHNYFDFDRKKEWACSSIFNAYEQYYWPISPKWFNKLKLEDFSFNSNKKLLDSFSDQIKMAYYSKNNDELYNVSKEILSWGGVLGSKKRGNLAYLDINRADLYHFYKTVEDKIANNADTDNDFQGIRMNAGFTKVYSLLFNNFIIYDGRVGAALGYLVRIFLEDKDIYEVPEMLKFYWGKARGKQLRNPSKGIYKFPALTNKSVPHIQCNIRANWLLKAIIQRFSFGDQTLERGALRTMEAALFMIGYDLNTDISEYKKISVTAKPYRKKENIMTTRTRLKTLSPGKNRDFEYSGSLTDAIRIYAGSTKAPSLIRKENCKKIVERYSDTGFTVIVGTSLTSPTPGSMGEG
ncbi:MAG: hypothetical protein PHV30_07010, partial [Candidatus Margulisbacteria bacterium]|nr:hypothetical protein [Candidatus Margulisiibacteriota bacterium]